MLAITLMTSLLFGLASLESQSTQFGGTDVTQDSKRSPSTCAQTETEQEALIRETVENKYLVRRVEFIGNTNTSDNVLRRKILLQEGDVFTRKKLVKSLENVTKLKKIIYPVKLSDVIIRLDHAEKSIDMAICFKERPGLDKKVSRSGISPGSIYTSTFSNPALLLQHVPSGN